MPTYTYRCQKCDEQFEVMQKITESPLTKCECGGELKKIIQPAGIIFKGSGFYKTDYAKKVSKDTAAPACDAANKSCPAACPSNN